jgi:hypothetical protein
MSNYPDGVTPSMIDDHYSWGCPECYIEEEGQEAYDAIKDDVDWGDLCPTHIAVGKAEDAERRQDDLRDRGLL